MHGVVRPSSAQPGRRAPRLRPRPSPGAPVSPEGRRAVIAGAPSPERSEQPHDPTPRRRPASRLGMPAQYSPKGDWSGSEGGGDTPEKVGSESSFAFSAADQNARDEMSNACASDRGESQRSTPLRASGTNAQAEPPDTGLESSAKEVVPGRRVTFLADSPAPQGSGQAAARFARQRQRQLVSTTLRRADKLSPRTHWFQSAVPARSTASPVERQTLETKASAFRKVPLVPEFADMSVAISPQQTDDEGKNEDEQQAGAQPAITSNTSNLSRTSDASHHSQVSQSIEQPEKALLNVGQPDALPQYVKSIWNNFHPNEELDKDKHGALVQALAGGTAVDEDAVLRHELQKIKTGEDVIAFFATHGDSTHVKVMYCRRAEVGACDFRPYDLVVVGEKERGHEYFMISSKGVVHVAPGGLSEHITLSEWMHQAMIFSVLTTMSFFRHYLAGKAFATWRTSARYLAYSSLRFRLSRKLFLGKPIFASAQARIHSLLYNVAATRLISCPLDLAGRALELTAFVAHQKELASCSEFDSKADAVRELVDVTLEKVLNSGQPDVSEAERHPKRQKGKSVAVERKEAQMRKHWKRIQELNVSLLGNFVRVVDVMLQSRLVGLVVAQAQDLLNRLEKSSKVFAVTVSFHGEKDIMEFTPDRWRYTESFTEVLDQAVDLVGSVAPLATSKKYDDHFRNQDAKPGKPSEVIRQSALFRSIRQGILDRVQIDFDKSQHFADSYFEPYRKIYEYGKICNQESFEARNLSHIELSEEMFLMRKFEDELEKLKAVHTTGCLLIDARTLKAGLAPIVESGLAMMKKRLKTAARDKCKSTYELFDQVNQELQQRPQQLEHFVEYVRSFRRTQNSLPQMEEMKNTVEEVYSMIRQYNMRVDINEEVMKEGLLHKAATLESTTLPEAAAFVEDMVGARIEEVSQKIHGLESEASTLRREFLTGVCAEVASIETPERVLEKLDQVDDQLNGLCDTGIWLNSCLELFRRPQTDTVALTAASDALELQVQTWELISQWDKMSNSWLASHPQFLDVVEIRSHIETLNQALWIVMQQMSMLPGVSSGVAKELQSRLLRWEFMLPMLTHLSNPHMTEDHWDSLMHKLKMTSGQPAELTLGKLREAGLGKAGLGMDSLVELSSIASAEAGALSVVRQMHDWDHRDLSLVCAREEHELWLLGDQSETLDLVAGDLTTLQVIATNMILQDDTRDRAREWLKKLRRIQDVLRLWLKIQQRYTELFGPVFAILKDIKNQPFDVEANQSIIALEDAFQPVEQAWKQLLTKARAHHRTVLAATQFLQPQLRKLENDMEPAEVCLRDFVMYHRRVCPRLFFLSDRDLLQALAESALQKAAKALEPFASRLFSGAASMHVVRTGPLESTDAGEKDVSPGCVALTFAEGSTLFVQLPAECEELPLHLWLERFTSTSNSIVHEHVRHAVQEVFESNPVTALRTWLGLPGGSRGGADALPSQAILLAFAIEWTQKVEAALCSADDDNMLGKPWTVHSQMTAVYTEQVEDLLKVMDSLSHASVPKPVSNACRATVAAVLLQALHARNVLETLRSECAGGLSRDSLDWQKHLRVYCDGHNATVCMMDLSVLYGCEYVGAAPRLVITPETERARLGTCMALRSHMLLAVAGQSGTGKTETIRDLAKFVAVPTFELLGESVSIRSELLNAVRGLVSIGGWGLYHSGLAGVESSNLSALASISNQLQLVLKAQQAALSEVDIDGQVVKINHAHPAAFFFILHGNSLGLPAVDFRCWPVALRAFTRPLAFALPTAEIVAQGLLLTVGFQFHHVVELGRKTATFVKALVGSQVSETAFVMTPTLHRVIRTAGCHLHEGVAPKEALARAAAEVVGASAKIESEAVWSNCSHKALWEDFFLHWVLGGARGSEDSGGSTYLTCAAVGSVVARSSDEAAAREAFVREIESHLSEYFLATETSVLEIEKVAMAPLAFRALELHGQILELQHVAITGVACSGKSVLLKALQSATVSAASNGYLQHKESLSLTRFFPGSLQGTSESVGCFQRLLKHLALDEQSSETEASQGLQEKPSALGQRVPVLVLDAELDSNAVWIEELYSVLPLRGLVLAFESRSLASCSPAMVARCAICPIGGLVQPLNMIEAFGERIKTHSIPGEISCSAIVHWLERLLESDVLAIVRQKSWAALTRGKDHADAVDLEMVARLLRMLEALICEHNGVREQFVDESSERELVELWAMYAAAWSLGGSLDADARAELGNALLKTFEDEECFSHGIARLGTLCEDALNLWRFQIIVSAGSVRCMLTSSLPLGPSLALDGKQALFVPTIETEMVRHICSNFSHSGQPFVLCGAPGSGKSSAVKFLLQSGGDLHWQSLLYRCRVGATGSHFVQHLQQKLDKYAVAAIGPAVGRQAYVVVDDMHLASGSVPEMIREVLDTGGLVDVRSLCYTSVQRVTFGSVAFPSFIHAARTSELSGKGSCSRWLRHFHQVRLQEMGNESLTRVFSELLSAWVPEQPTEVQHAVDGAIGNIVKLVGDLNRHLPYQPRRPFRGCTLMDISRWCKGMLRATVPSETLLKRLVTHESVRQFGDRLGTKSDYDILSNLMAAADMGFKDGQEPLFALQSTKRGIARSSITSEKGTEGSFTYRDLGAAQHARRVLHKSLEASMQTFRYPFVLLNTVMSAVVGVARALAFPVSPGQVGGVLILGHQGSGKRSCALLGAHLAHVNVTPLTALDSRSVRNELHEAMAAATKPCRNESTDELELSESSRRVVFGPVLEAQLRSDMCSSDGFLDYVDSLLRGATDEKVLLGGSGKDEKRRPDSEIELMVALCLCPDLDFDRFQRRMRRFPGLASNLSVIWLREWTFEAHFEVAQAVLVPDGATHGHEEFQAREALRTLANVASVLPTLIPGQSFCDHSLFLASLCLLNDAMASRRSELEKRTLQLETALRKLESSNSPISPMQRPATSTNDDVDMERQSDLQQELVEKQNDLREKREVEEELLRKHAPLVEELQSLQAYLDDAMAPKHLALGEALEQLKAMTKEQILECQRLDNPPPQVAGTLFPLLIALGLPEEWKELTTFLDEPDPVSRLEALSPQHLDQNQIRLMEDHMLDPAWGEELGEGLLQVAGGAFALACGSFLQALLAAAQAWQGLKPTWTEREEVESRVKEVEQNIELARQAVATSDKEMMAIEGTLRELGSPSDRARGESDVFEGGTGDLQTMLRDEGQKWQEQLSEVQTLLQELPGNLLLAAFLAHYAGPLPQAYRDDVFSQWCAVCDEQSVPYNSDLSIVEVLKSLDTEECLIDIAASVGSCVDPCSAWICLQSRLPVFLIDPMGVGRQWLLEHLNRTSQTGAAILSSSTLQSTESLESLKTVARKEAPAVVDLRDAEIPFSLERALALELAPPESLLLDLRLFLVSSAAIEDPLGVGTRHQRTVVVNFCIASNPIAQRQRLLDTVLLSQAPELRSILLESRALEASLIAQRQRLECKMLEALSDDPKQRRESTDSSPQGSERGLGLSPRRGSVNILGDVIQLQSAIEDADDRREEAAADMLQAEEAVAKWEKLAKTGVALYRALLDTNAWHSTYRCSWHRFMQWFCQALGQRDVRLRSTSGLDLSTSSMSLSSVGALTAKQEALVASFIRSAPTKFYNAMVHSFHPQHHLPFAFRLAVRLGETQGALLENEVDTLLSAFALDENEDVEEDFDDGPDWLEDPIAWRRLSLLAVERPSINAVIRNLKADSKSWDWIVSARSGQWPPVAQSTLRNFQKLAKHYSLTSMDSFLVTCALAPRLGVTALRNYIDTELGTLEEHISPRQALIEVLRSTKRAQGKCAGLMLAVTEGSSDLDYRGEFLSWLDAAAAKASANVSTFSARDRSCPESVLAVMERRDADSPLWICVTDICNKQPILPQLWSVAWRIVESVEEGSEVLLILEVEQSFNSQAFLSQSHSLLPAGLMAAASRVVLAQPLSLRSRLLGYLDEEAEHKSRVDDNYYSTCGSYPKATIASSLKAGFLWVFASVVGRSTIRPSRGHGCGWALPYVWSKTDMSFSRSLLEDWCSEGSASQLELAKLAVLLSFGVHVEDGSDRAALEAIVSHMASSKGPLEIWKQLVPPDAVEKLPVTMGLEEMRAFVNVAMPEDDVVTSSNYLATAYGLSPGGQARQIDSRQVGGDTMDLMLILQGADVLELPGPGPPREETVLKRANEIETLVKDWISSITECLGPSLSESRDSQQQREVLHQELHSLLRLLVVVLESVMCTKDALEGTAQDSQSFDSVFQALWNNTVPSAWDMPHNLDSASGTSLTAWLQITGNRVQYFQRWSQEGPPVSCWVGALASPQWFKMAILRQYAMEQEFDVDKLELVTEVTSIKCSGEFLRPEDFVSEENRLAKGSLVHGFALFGALWSQDDEASAGFLDDRPPSPNEDPWLPVLKLIPVLSKDCHDRSENRFHCPVYRRARERDGQSGGSPLLHLDLPSKQDSQLWALRGVSLLFELPT